MQDLHSGTITRAYCRAIYEESVSRCFILPPEQGEVRRSRIGGGERSEPISRMLIIPYDTESQSRNADFKNCGEAPPPPSESSRRNQITLSAPHRTVRAVFPHTALRIVLGLPYLYSYPWIWYMKIPYFTEFLPC